jgi:hypothetical protein
MRPLCQASVWRAPAAAHVLLPVHLLCSQSKSRLNCGIDETELRTIQFSFFGKRRYTDSEFDRAADALAIRRAPGQVGT